MLQTEKGGWSETKLYVQNETLNKTGNEIQGSTLIHLNIFASRKIKHEKVHKYKEVSGLHSYEN